MVWLFGRRRELRARQLNEDMLRACLVGNAAAVEVAIESGASVHVIDQLKGRSPLHQAAVEGHSRVVRVLLKNGAPTWLTDRVYNRTPLHWATCVKYEHKMLEYERIVDNLLEEHADLRCKEQLYQRTPLHFAVIHGSCTMVANILKKTVDPNIPDVDGRTPLHLAAARGDLELVCLLLEAKADPSITDKGGKMPGQLSTHPAIRERLFGEHHSNSPSSSHNSLATTAHTHSHPRTPDSAHRHMGSPQSSGGGGGSNSLPQRNHATFLAHGVVVGGESDSDASDHVA